jgi:alkylation response protein AidB-like acyl-CoA dehydrogenase
MSELDLRSLRREVRRYAREAEQAGKFEPAVNGQGRFDRRISRELAERGWVGGTIPAELGGHPLPAPAQWVIAEELIAASLPLAAHWVGERQTARLLLRFGSAELKARLLPAMARGEVAFGIGMSEPGSGSDLASVRTRATRWEDGWVISGQKIWTSSAYQMDYLVVLCRTSDAEDKRDGLSQLLVPTSAPGLEIRRIPSMDGDDDICEVFFSEVLVPGDHLIGTPGEGWRQITTELSFERAWPDRYATHLALIEAFRKTVQEGPGHLGQAALGRLVSRLMSLRSLSWQAVAGAVAGRDVSATAALAKDAGTTFERTIASVIRDADVEGKRHEAGPLRTHFRHASALAPQVTIRGGTNEILRGIIGRQLRAPLFSEELSPAEAAVEDLLRRELEAEAGSGWAAQEWEPRLWSTLAELGFTGELSVAGQGDLPLPEALGILRLAAYHLAPVPLAESAFLAPWLLHAAGAASDGDGLVTIAGATDLRALQVTSDGALRGAGVLASVPWGAAEVAVIAWNGAAPEVIVAPADEVLDASGAGTVPFYGADLSLDGWTADASQRFPLPTGLVAEYRLRGALARSAQLVGAMDRAVDLAIAYAGERRQFGQRIAKFQAVRDLLVGAARELALARAAVRTAVGVAAQGWDADGLEVAVAAAKSAAGRASVEVARSTHQVHAAIGITREYPLHRLTRQMTQWRDEFGTEHEWESRIGQAATTADIEHAWDFITQIEVAGLAQPVVHHSAEHDWLVTEMGPTQARQSSWKTIRPTTLPTLSSSMASRYLSSG